MTITGILKLLTSVASITILTIGCKNKNHIDKYNVSLDSLKTLPDNFYAYRRGSIYLEDVNTENYRIWFNRDNGGNVKNIFRIEDFRDLNNKSETVIKAYSIDTSFSKMYAQKFIDLSKRYKFGHIYVDRKNKISFSYKDGLFEQYVKGLNDSINQIYMKNKDFKLLSNGWFENSEH